MRTQKAYSAITQGILKEALTANPKLLPLHHLVLGHPSAISEMLPPTAVLWKSIHNTWALDNDKWPCFDQNGVPEWVESERLAEERRQPQSQSWGDYELNPAGRLRQASLPSSGGRTVRRFPWMWSSFSWVSSPISLGSEIRSLSLRLS